MVGSGAMFSDQYIDKEDNSRIKDVLIEFLTATSDAADAVKLNPIDAEDPDISDYNMVPDSCRLAENLRSCLQESDEIPASDPTSLFDTKLFSVSTVLVPAAIKAYGLTSVKHEALRLIPPQFETPLPSLQPAVFPPTFRDLPNPRLELFDLDEAFSSEKSRLAQITNKCTDDDNDIEYYVREAADILGVLAPRRGPGPAGTPGTGGQRHPGGLNSSSATTTKGILEQLLAQISELKKLNQGGLGTSGLDDLLD